MGNIDNLVYNKGFDTRSTEELSEITRRGGINSGISRKRKYICNKLLNGEITNQEAKEELRKRGLADDELTELALSMYDLLSTSRDKKKVNTRDRLLALKMFMDYADNTNVIEQTTTPELKIEIVNNESLESDFNEDK